MSTDLHPSLAALPNAVHIARVLTSLKANPKAWASARAAARADAWASAWAAARADAWAAARDTAWGPARAPAWDAAWAAARTAARDTAWGALLALIAWDDSARLLSLTPDQLQAHHMVTEDPAAVLLLPAVMAFGADDLADNPALQRCEHGHR